MAMGQLLFSLFPDPLIRKRGVGFFLAWLIPGLGHVFLGHWKKGIFYFFLLGLTYIFGLWICGFRTVSWEVNPFYYIGQFGCGLSFFLGHTLGGINVYPQSNPLFFAWYDPGLLYVCVASLLNLVVAMNVIELKLAGEKSPPKPKVKEADSAKEVEPEVGGESA